MLAVLLEEFECDSCETPQINKKLKCWYMKKEKKENLFLEQSKTCYFLLCHLKKTLSYFLISIKKHPKVTPKMRLPTGNKNLEPQQHQQEVT